MLIPSIDLQDGHVVQLVQGETLAIEAPDPEPWIARFSRVSARAAHRPRCRARAGATTRALVHRSAAGFPAASAAASAASSARARSSRRRARRHRQLGALPRRRRRRGFARALADAVGAERVIAAVDSRGGQVAIHGWKTVLPITAVEAVRALEPFCAEFLYTHVDKEGLMQGTDMEAILAVRRATTRRVTAAGGITTWEEIDRLDAAGVDAVVGMAIYTGQLPLNGSWVSRWLGG